MKTRIDIFVESSGQKLLINHVQVGGVLRHQDTGRRGDKGKRPSLMPGFNDRSFDQQQR